MLDFGGAEGIKHRDFKEGLMKSNLDEFSEELRRVIKATYADNTALRDFWLRVTDAELDRVRREDTEPFRPGLSRPAERLD